MMKICLNCRNNWDECKGIYCQTWDGVCSCDVNQDDMKYKAFWYVEED